MYSPELLRLGIAESSIVGKKWKEGKVTPQSEVISDGAYHKALFGCLSCVQCLSLRCILTFSLHFIHSHPSKLGLIVNMILDEK